MNRTPEQLTVALSLIDSALESLDAALATGAISDRVYGDYWRAAKLDVEFLRAEVLTDENDEEDA